MGIFTAEDALNAFDTAIVRSGNEVFLVKGINENWKGNDSWYWFDTVLREDIKFALLANEREILFMSEFKELVEGVIRERVELAIAAFSNPGAIAEGNKSIAKIGKVLRADGGADFIARATNNFIRLIDRELRLSDGPSI